MDVSLHNFFLLNCIKYSYTIFNIFTTLECSTSVRLQSSEVGQYCRETSLLRTTRRI